MLELTYALLCWVTLEALWAVAAVAPRKPSFIVAPRERRVRRRWVSLSTHCTLTYAILHAGRLSERNFRRVYEGICWNNKNNFLYTMLIVLMVLFSFTINSQLFWLSASERLRRLVKSVHCTVLSQCTSVRCTVLYQCTLCTQAMPVDFWVLPLSPCSQSQLGCLIPRKMFWYKSVQIYVSQIL